MLKELHIKNFLSHKKTELKFSPGVNIIVGESDSGKSVIIRALRWVVFNRPSGDSIRSTWGGDTSVDLVLDGGRVKRVKSKKDNMYVLGDNVELKAIRTDVPEEVGKLINMSSLNLQTQFESHFLLSRTAGERAQYFNSIAHLDKIDIGLRNIAKWIRGAQVIVTSEQDSLLRLEGELQEYKDINIIEGKIQKLERFIDDETLKENGIENLEKLIKKTKSVSKEIMGFRAVVKGESYLKSVVNYSQKYNKLEAEKNELEWLVLEIDVVEEDISFHERVLKGEETVKKLKILNTKIHEKVKEELLFENTIKYIEMLISEDGKSEKKLLDMEERFHKNVGEVCPLCGNKIK